MTKNKALYYCIIFQIFASMIFDVKSLLETLLYFVAIFV